MKSAVTGFGMHRSAVWDAPTTLVKAHANSTSPVQNRHPQPTMRRHGQRSAIAQLSMFCVASYSDFLDVPRSSICCDTRPAAACRVLQQVGSAHLGPELGELLVYLGFTV